MKKIFLVLVTLGLFSLAYGQQSSQSKDANWVKIGEAKVNLNEDYSIFDWDRDREESVNANDKYSAIKFKAKDAKVNISNVEVQYDNGKKENMKLESAISADSESKQVKIDTREDLDKVTFNFIKDDSAPREDAVIEIWGLKAGASGMGSGRDIDVDVDVDTVNARR